MTWLRFAHLLWCLLGAFLLGANVVIAFMRGMPDLLLHVAVVAVMAPAVYHEFRLYLSRI